MHFFTEPPTTARTLEEEEEVEVDDVEARRGEAEITVGDDDNDVGEIPVSDDDEVKCGLSTYSFGLARCRCGESILTISRGGGRGGNAGVVVDVVACEDVDVVVVDEEEEEKAGSGGRGPTTREW